MKKPVKNKKPILVAFVPGPNTDPNSPQPVFAEPCKRTDKGAWQNLGGHWVRERRN